MAINKRDFRHKANNHGPVILKSALCKHSNRMITEQLCSKIVNNIPMTSVQYGFLRSMSCLTKLFMFLDETNDLMGEGKAAEDYYLGFSKAFGHVSLFLPNGNRQLGRELGSPLSVAD